MNTLKTNNKNKIINKLESPKPTIELQHALIEGEKIVSGKIKTKKYKNLNKLFNDIINE